MIPNLDNLTEKEKQEIKDALPSVQEKYYPGNPLGCLKREQEKEEKKAQVKERRIQRRIQQKAQDESKGRFQFDIRKVLMDGYNNGGKYDLMVIKWGRNPDGKYVLEKRRVWKKQGEKRFGGVAGLSLEELDFVIANVEEIKSLLK